MKKIYLLIFAAMLLPGCALLQQLGFGSGSGTPKEDVVIEDGAMMDDEGVMMEGDEEKKMMEDAGGMMEEEVKKDDDAMMEDEDKMMEGEEAMEKEEGDSAMMEGKVEAKYAAGTINTYSEEAFAEAVANGEKVMLDFYAAWCPICRGNAPLIEAAASDSNVVFFKVDYDNETALKSKFGVTTQSTLVLLNGDSEVARVVGAQTEGSLDTFLAS